MVRLSTNHKAKTLLGVCIVYELKFDTHMKTLCQKMGKNLLTLSQVIKFMFPNQAQLLMRGFVMSQFSCSRLTWMCSSRNINNQINKLYECVLRFAYNDKSSSF